MNYNFKLNLYCWSRSKYLSLEILFLIPMSKYCPSFRSSILRLFFSSLFFFFSPNSLFLPLFFSLFCFFLLFLISFVSSSSLFPSFPLCLSSLHSFFSLYTLFFTFFFTTSHPSLCPSPIPF